MKIICETRCEFQEFMEKNIKDILINDLSIEKYMHKNFMGREYQEIRVTMDFDYFEKVV